MSIVVDASIAAKWLIDEEDSDLAAQLLVEDLIAPAILRLECVSAVLKRLRMGELREGQVRQRISEIDRLPIRFHDVDEAEAVELAIRLRHPVYDCLYLALARRQGVQLITADARFVRAAAAAELGAHIRLLADYAQ